MNASNLAVKTTAKLSLKNRYTGGIVAASVFLFSFIVCSFCVDMAGTVFGNVGAYITALLLLIFLIMPLTTGYVYWGVRLIFTEDSEPVLIFKYFSGKADYIKSLKLSLIITGNLLLTGILVFLPYVFADLIASGKLFILFNARIPLWASSLWSVARFLKDAGFIALFFAALKYYLVPFLIAADEEMDPLEAIHMSKIISSGSKKAFIALAFSLILYIAACFLVIPIIFILPYFTAAYAVHCRFAVASYNKNVDSINQKDVPSFSADMSF